MPPKIDPARGAHKTLLCIDGTEIVGDVLYSLENVYVVYDCTARQFKLFSKNYVLKIG